MTSATVPFRLAAEDRPLLIVATAVNGGGPYDFVLDTGASAVIVDETVAAELGLARSRAVEARGAGGSLAVAATRLAELAIGGLAVHGLEAGIADLAPIAAAVGAPIQGIVGHPFLSRMVVTIDYPGRRLGLDLVEGPGLVQGMQVVRLFTTGRRSGVERAVEIYAHEHGGGVSLVATNWGRPVDPGWCHNLAARPEARIEVDGRSHPMRARTAGGEERERLMAEATARFPRYEELARQAGRPIPVVVLDPVADGADRRPA